MLYSVNVWLRKLKRISHQKLSASKTLANSCLFIIVVHIINSFGYWCAVCIYYSRWVWMILLVEAMIRRYHKCKSIWEKPLNGEELTYNHWTNPSSCWLVLLQKAFSKITYQWITIKHYLCGMLDSYHLL